MGVSNLRVANGGMEDSGITSYSSGSVDVSLETLDISTNIDDSGTSAGCESSEVSSAHTASAQTQSRDATEESSSDTTSCAAEIKDPGNLELQRHVAA